MSSCIPIATQLLRSKFTSDVLESLQFLSTAVEFEVRRGREGGREGERDEMREGGQRDDCSHRQAERWTDRHT